MLNTVSDKDKKPRRSEDPLKNISSDPENEDGFIPFEEDDEEEKISDEQKYWEKYFEDEDEELRSRGKKLKKKGKFKDRDFE